MPIRQSADAGAGRFAGVLDFTRLAFELSEKFDTPVMIRSCTRISHGKSIVHLGEPVTGLPTRNW